MNTYKTRSREVAFTGIMMAVVLVLTWLENLFLTQIPGLPPGVRLGLSNIIIMYCVRYLHVRDGIIISALKVIFVFATRGFTAGLLSFTGTLLSMLVLVLLRDIPPMILLSILSSVTHNIGQIIGCMIILKTWTAVYYLPVLLLTGIAVGALTGIILKTVLSRIHLIEQSTKK